MPDRLTQVVFNHSLAVEVRHPGVLVGSGNRTEHQVRNPGVLGGADDGTALGYLGIHPCLKRGRQRKRPGNVSHRRSQGDAVAERAGDNLDAALS